MSGSAASVPFLAQHGFRPTYFTGLDTLVEFATLYVEEARAAGSEYALGARQNIARWIHLGRNEAEFTGRLLRYDYEMWVQHYSKFYDGIPKFDNTDATVQSMKDSGIFLGGTVEQLKAQWRHIYDRLPCEYITLIWHYAHCPKELMLEELGVFLTQVLPELDATASDDQCHNEA